MPIISDYVTFRRIFRGFVRPICSGSCLICAALILVLISGCEEDVTAVLGTDRPYSLYGVLSPELDSQWVRVFPIEDRLEPETAQQLDADFISRDLLTDEEYVWRDSLILDAFGQPAHVFWAPFTAEYGHDYHLHVRRADGAESSVTVSVPPRTDIVVQEAEVTSTISRIPVLIAGGAPRLLRVEVEYGVGYLPAGDANPTGGLVVVPYSDLIHQSPEGWIVPIDLESDFHAVSDSLVDRIDRPIDRGFGLVLNVIRLQLIVASEEWNPPGGVFNPEVLVQPGTLSNVSNGFGFVGAGYRHSKEWIPEPRAALAAGFRTSED